MSTRSCSYLRPSLCLSLTSIRSQSHSYSHPQTLHLSYHIYYFFCRFQSNHIFHNGFLGYVFVPPLVPGHITDTAIDHGEDSYEQVYNNDNFEENKSSFSHELVAGGAAFAGFKAFEDHQREEGSSTPHSLTLNKTYKIFRQARLPRFRQGARCWIRCR